MNIPGTEQLINMIINYAELNDFALNLPSSEHNEDEITKIDINFEKKQVTFN